MIYECKQYTDNKQANQAQIMRFNPYIANCNKSRLLCSSAEMFKKPLWQTVFWVNAVCFYTLFVSNVRQLFVADDFSRRHFQMHIFLAL